MGSRSAATIASRRHEGVTGDLDVEVQAMLPERPPVSARAAAREAAGPGGAVASASRRPIASRPGHPP